METVIAQWQKVKENIAKACIDSRRAPEDVQLIAVSKTFGVEDIRNCAKNFLISNSISSGRYNRIKQKKRFSFLT